jgi:hypothetical protein
MGERPYFENQPVDGSAIHHEIVRMRNDRRANWVGGLSSLRNATYRYRGPFRSAGLMQNSKTWSRSVTNVGKNG